VFLFVSYGATLIVLSAFKSLEIFLPALHSIERALGGDKWMHFTLSAFLSILACFASGRVLDLAALKRAAYVYVVLFMALSLDEMMQYTLASRRFELLDLAYGSLGLLIGVLGYLSAIVVRRAKHRVRKYHV